MVRCSSQRFYLVHVFEAQKKQKAEHVQQVVVLQLRSFKSIGSWASAGICVIFFSRRNSFFDRRTFALFANARLQVACITSGNDEITVDSTTNGFGIVFAEHRSIQRSNQHERRIGAEARDECSTSWWRVREETTRIGT